MRVILQLAVTLALVIDLSLIANLTAFQTNDTSLLILSDRTGEYQVFLTAPDGSYSQQISSGSERIEDAACSPDGRYVALTGSHRGIHIIDRRDQSLQALFADDDSPYSDVTWSWDRQQIAFVAAIGHGFDIYTSLRDGTQIRQITTSAHIRERSLTWSPDSRSIVYSATDTQGTDLFSVDLITQQIMRLTSDPGMHIFPDWSFVRNQIVYSREQNHTLQLALTSPVGMQQVNLTMDPGPNWRPVWSPNSREIAFTSGRDGNPEVYTMNADGSGIRRVTTNTTDDYVVCWLPASGTL